MNEQPTPATDAPARDTQGGNINTPPAPPDAPATRQEAFPTGKWEIKHDAPTGTVDIVHEGQIIAHVWGDDETALAIARLIAKAPEMYTFISGLVVMWRNIEHIAICAKKLGSAQEADRLASAAEKILKKARGDA